MTHNLSTAGKRWLIVGCGYVGTELARQAQAAGDQVYALTRSNARSEELRQQNIEPIVGHWLDPDSLRDLPCVDSVLVSVPHRADSSTQQDIAEEEIIGTHTRGLGNLLQALPADWRRLVYLSTTGVYGQDSSDPVDEATPVHPTRLGPKMAVAAEKWLHAQPADERFTVLRLAGIYGPGRIPLANKLRQGEPLAVPLDGHLNLVHVRDIGRMIHVVAGRAMQLPTYVFSDGQPVLRETFYRRVAELCHVPEPTFIAADPQDAKARRATDKRIDPSRLVAETRFVYQYPDYQSGLAAAL